jgi:predicted RNase H-like nuclease (RuvC/YqgF family)
MSATRIPSATSNALSAPKRVNHDLEDILEATKHYNECKQLQADLKTTLEQLTDARKQLLHIESKWTRVQTRSQQLKACQRRLHHIKHTNELYQLKCMIRRLETTAEQWTRQLERATSHEKLSTGPGWKY